jgi:putative membrane protein
MPSIRHVRAHPAQRLLLAALLGLLALSLWSPPFPRYQLLQHLPTVPAWVALFFAARRGTFALGSFAALAALLALHILGARWTYSFVPYDVWSRELFGWSPQVHFGWTRNHYDRFVHLMFGLLAVAPLAVLLERRSRLARRAAALVACSALLAASGLYEVFEWLLTIAVAPDQAETYNGQQGDAFDAQKDMALAALGAAVTTFLRAWPAPSSAHPIEEHRS